MADFWQAVGAAGVIALILLFGAGINYLEIR